MELNPQISITDTLKQAQAQQLYIEVYLRGGQCFKGKILGVADYYAVVGYLQGKEFFDVLLRLEDISAVSLQTRGK